MAQGRDDSFKLSQFGGMLPAWDDHFLPDSQAASSTNGYLFSGALESWRVPKLLHTTVLSNPGYVYRLPKKSQASATATVSFVANPSEGDKITLGEEVYKFTATVTNAYDVKIGANDGASATNLFRAFTFNDGEGTDAGTLYGVGTVANPAIDQTSPKTKNTIGLTSPAKVTVVAPDFGAAYNSTLVGSSSAHLAWLYNGTPTTTFLGGANVDIETNVTGTSTWLEYTDPDTDVVRSPVVDDQFDRYYMASASVAPQYNTRDRIEAGLPPWLLGVPAPGCTPTVEVTGGGNTAQLGFPNTVSASAGAPGANTIYLIPVTPDGAMSLNDINIVPAVTNPTANFVAVLYNDLNGSPHQLLNVGVEVQGFTAGSSVSSGFVNPTGLLMNTQYWIGIATDTAAAFHFANDTGTTGVVSLNTYSNGPAFDIENLQTGFGELQLWANMTSSSVLDARAYVYTYVSEYGEESPPSPPTNLIGWSNGTWAIGLFQPPPDQLGITRNLKKINVYRTVTALSGSTEFFFVDTVDITVATYTDVITDDLVVLNNILQSQLWTPPPEGIQGLVVMPNGIIAGWQGNEIWFCEPYRPHAWPPSYVQTSEYPIVGLGVTGNAVVAATTGAPYIVSGTTPSQMSALKVQNSEPCHSRKSIVGNTDGVYYASRNGLILVDTFGSVRNTTEGWITRERWQQLTPQSNLCAIFVASAYFAFQRTADAGGDGLGQRGFIVELDAGDAKSFGILPQPGGHRLGFQLMDNQLPAALAMMEIDPWSGVALVVAGNNIYQYDFTDATPVLSVLDWRSKLFQKHTKKNYAALRIAFSVPPGTPALNATRKVDAFDDPSWNAPLPSDRYGYIFVYAGGVLVTVREIRVVQEILRIVSGFKHETWQIRVVSRVKITGIQMGTSVKGMANV